jgi:predicted O-methyltransferase YrrM
VRGANTIAAVKAQDIAGLLDAVADLPPDWHGAGSSSRRTLGVLAQYAQEIGGIEHSLETGAGRTTLVLSNLSADHMVFTKDDTGDGNSLAAVRKSPLLRADSCRFVVGPTQRTLLAAQFDVRLDLVLLDGPHAYPFPDLEYWATYPHLREGGLLVIDDIQIPTIGKMYEFLSADRMWERLCVVGSTAFFRRTEAEAVDPLGEGWWQQGYNASRSYRGHLPIPERVARTVVPEAILRAERRRLRP